MDSIDSTDTSSSLIYSPSFSPRIVSLQDISWQGIWGEVLVAIEIKIDKLYRRWRLLEVRVIAMFMSLLNSILLGMPILDTSRIRGSDH